ncbi:hypothetical protein [Streptomyces mirabilis]|uniref:hypothetical protein n=1 Tax=Streptomyces mirabilis TaxID=68239 RepID=UPI0033D9EC8B
MSFQLTLPADMTDFAAELLAADTDLTSAPFSLARSCPSMRERIQELAVCLRAAEEQCTGLQRERWGYAAANAEAAADACHPFTRRWLWETAYDYARLAADDATTRFTAEGDLPVRRVDGSRVGRRARPAPNTIITLSKRHGSVATLRVRLSGAGGLPTRRARG